MSQTVHLHVPISEDEIRSLQLNDVVYITGAAYAMLYVGHYTLYCIHSLLAILL